MHPLFQILSFFRFIKSLSIFRIFIRPHFPSLPTLILPAASIKFTGNYFVRPYSINFCMLEISCWCQFITYALAIAIDHLGKGSASLKALTRTLCTNRDSATNLGYKFILNSHSLLCSRCSTLLCSCFWPADLLSDCMSLLTIDVAIVVL